MSISIASRKAKGRNFQQKIRDEIRNIGVRLGLIDEDIHSTGMGQSGVDIVLTPAARKFFDWYCECKNQQSLNVYTTFVTHFAKYKDKLGLKLLFHTKNHGPSLVTLRSEDFFKLIEENLEFRYGGSRAEINKETTGVVAADF